MGDGAARAWEEKGEREEEGGRAGPLDWALPRQAGWRGSTAAPVHVAPQGRAHTWRARRGRPAWQSCCAAACGATAAACRATQLGAAKGVTACKKSPPGVIFKNKLKKG
jgi:hypothetical protein